MAGQARGAGLISAALIARLLAHYFQLVYDAEVRGIVVTNSLGYATLLVQLIPKERY